MSEKERIRKFYVVFNCIFMLLLVLGTVVYLGCASYVEFGLKGPVIIVTAVLFIVFEFYGYYSLKKPDD